jgi:hypothetical protein
MRKTLNRLIAIHYKGSSPVRRTDLAYNSAAQWVRITERFAAATMAASAVGGTVFSDRCYAWFPGDAQPAEEREAGSLSFTAPASNAATSAGTVINVAAKVLILTVEERGTLTQKNIRTDSRKECR